MKPKRHTVQLDGDGFRVLGCFGADACARRTQDAPDLPQRIHDAVDAIGIGAIRRAQGRSTDAFHGIVKINISYCPNACARSQIADVGLIGARVPALDAQACEACGACSEVCREDAIRLDDDGFVTGVDHTACVNCGECINACPTDALYEARTGFRLMLGGKLGRHPRFAEELSGLLSPEKLPELVARCIRNYLRLARGRERMGDVVSRVGAAALVQEDAD